MIRKPSDREVVGLHLDGLTLKLVALDTHRGRVKVKRLEAFSLIVKDEQLQFEQAGEDRICHELCDRHLTVASLDGKESLVRKMRIKLVKESAVEEAFRFEAEGSIPYPIEEGIVDKIVVDKDEEATELTLLSCKKSALGGYLDRFHALKLDPEVVTCTPASLAAFASRYINIEGNLVVVYLGESSSLSAIVRNGKLISSHSLPLGIAALRRAYEEDQAREPEILTTPFQQFDFSGDEVSIALQLKKEIYTFKQELNWMILSEIKSLRQTEQEGTPLLTLGEGSVLKGIDPYLFGDLTSPRVELTAMGGIELNQSLLSRFAIAIGSALSALPHYPDPINFRQEELAYPEPWKRFKPSLYVLGASATLLAALIFLTGIAYLGYREDLLREKYSETLAEMGKRETITPLKELTPEEIDARLNTLQKEIQSQPDLFPLLPNVPLVSDTLAWLSTHPQMSSEEGAIKIESFNYQMVKRPEMTKKGDRYQVKVDLEISAPTPKMAREFHNALISPNDFVDPKSEVKWSASRGRYQTSFYLKDKTVYLPAGNR